MFKAGMRTTWFQIHIFIRVSMQIAHEYCFYSGKSCVKARSTITYYNLVFLEDWNANMGNYRVWDEKKEFFVYGSLSLVLYFPHYFSHQFQGFVGREIPNRRPRVPATLPELQLLLLLTGVALGGRLIAPSWRWCRSPSLSCGRERIGGVRCWGRGMWCWVMWHGPRRCPEGVRWRGRRVGALPWMR